MRLDTRGFSMRVCLEHIIGTDEEKVFIQYLEDYRTKFPVPVPNIALIPSGEEPFTNSL